MASLITLANAQRRTANRLDASAAARDDARDDHNARMKAADQALLLSTVSGAAGMAHGKRKAAKTPPIVPEAAPGPGPQQQPKVSLDAAAQPKAGPAPAASAQAAANAAQVEAPPPAAGPPDGRARGQDEWGAGLGAAAGSSANLLFEGDEMNERRQYTPGQAAQDAVSAYMRGFEFSEGVADRENQRRRQAESDKWAQEQRGQQRKVWDRNEKQWAYEDETRETPDEVRERRQEEGRGRRLLNDARQLSLDSAPSAEEARAARTRQATMDDLNIAGKREANQSARDRNAARRRTTSSSRSGSGCSPAGACCSRPSGRPCRNRSPAPPGSTWAAACSAASDWPLA